MCHMVEKFNSVSPFFLNSQQYHVFTKISLLYIQLKPQIELKDFRARIGANLIFFASPRDQGSIVCTPPLFLMGWE